MQEAEPKIAALPHVEWHLVGRLQTNKARRAVRSFSVIHSVDTLDLLRRIDALAIEERRTPRILLQVNLSQGSGASGLSREETDAREVAAALAELQAATVVGLMTIAAMGAGEADARATFAALRTVRDRLQERAGVEMSELSMGMSADAEAAAAEGATLVRIGTALFGSRG